MFLLDKIQKYKISTQILQNTWNTVALVICRKHKAWMCCVLPHLFMNNDILIDWLSFSVWSIVIKLLHRKIVGKIIYVLNRRLNYWKYFKKLWFYFSDHFLPCHKNGKIINLVLTNCIKVIFPFDIIKIGFSIDCTRISTFESCIMFDVLVINR